MKRVCLLLCAALLCAAFLLPLSAAALPKNAATAAAMERVGATVGTDTPGAAVLLYDAACQNGQSLVAWHIVSFAVHEDASVGVSVVGDTQYRAGGLDHLDEVLKVVLGGFAGVSGELSLGIAVEGDGPHAQLPEQQGRGVVGGTVGTVEDHGEVGRADGS